MCPPSPGFGLAVAFFRRLAAINYLARASSATDRPGLRHSGSPACLRRHRSCPSVCIPRRFRRPSASLPRRLLLRRLMLKRFKGQALGFHAPLPLVL